MELEKVRGGKEPHVVWGDTGPVSWVMGGIEGWKGHKLVRAALGPFDCFTEAEPRREAKVTVQRERGQVRGAGPESTSCLRSWPTWGLPSTPAWHPLPAHKACDIRQVTPSLSHTGSSLKRGTGLGGH